MDHRSLYKSKKANDAKNERVIASQKLRSDKRRDMHAHARDVSISPQNVQRPSESTSKKNNFYLKYAAWKEEKAKRQAEEKKNRKIPFQTVVRSENNSIYSFSSSFAPTDYCFNAIFKEHNDNNEKKEALKSSNKKKIPTKTINNKIQKENNNKLNIQNSNSKNNIKKPVLKKQNTVKTPMKNKIIVPTLNNSKLDDTTFKSYTAFENFVTSTQRKSASKNSNVSVYDSTFADNISPIGTKTILSNKSVKSSNSKPKIEPVKSKISADTPVKRSNYVLAPEQEENSCVNDLTFDATDNMDLNKTPVNQVEENNYVSPYVTTSRGKHSFKREREKRDSIYKLEKNCTPNESIDNRRKRESTKYFRKVLDEEIQRLHGMCADWEKYKLDNIHIIDQSSIDMIFVAIAQTKLLTSKKFEQFRGLIDQCEMLCAPGPAVLPEDLEGFWSMIKVQVEDIDKRFANLNMWKANGWIDPEEIKPKMKKMSKSMKPKKTKTNVKASNIVMDLIKQAKSECMRSRQQGITLDTDVILLQPNQKELTPKPRKLRARTILPDNPTPKRQSARRASVSHQGNMLKNAVLNSSRKKTPSDATSFRKSILKTPGTARKNKSVIFNETLLFKSPDISFGRKSDVDVPDNVNDSARSLRRLRSRSVHIQNEQ